MLNIFLTALIIIMNISLITTLVRLKIKHNDVFVQLGLNETFFGSPKQLARIIEFMVKRKHAKLKDNLLSVAGYAFVTSISVTIPFILVYVLKK